MEEETARLSDEKKTALAVRIAALLRDETGGDDNTMIFVIKTAAGLIWGPNYESRGVKL